MIVSLEEKKILKDIKNRSKLKKELNNTAIKDIGNLFRLEKETKEVKRAHNEIINFKKKKMKLLTKEQQESYENAKICYICKENLKLNI